MFKFFKKDKAKISEKDITQTLKEEQEQNIIQQDNDKEDINQSTSLFSRLKQGLSKTRKQFNKLFGVVNIDSSWLEQLEETLLLSDVGITTTNYLMDNLIDHIKSNQPSTLEVKQYLEQLIINILEPLQGTINLQHNLNAIMLIGVNGAGKTTSIGKLCKYFSDINKKIILAASDTFRAAATEQLQSWGHKNNIHVISNSGDPAAVSFDAIQSAQAKNYDIVIIDTAGRLPTQNHLLEELKKIKRVSERALNKELNEILLVLDGNTGQNAIQQVKIFNEAVKISGLIITKLDGSAKGGVILAIAQECQIPIYFIGVGEGLQDLQIFNAKNFAHALLE